MVRGLTTTLMVAIVALHAGFGCCWHHDHAVASTVPADAAISTSGHAGCHCTHQRSPADGQTPSDTPHDHCDEDSCQFVSTATASASWLPSDGFDDDGPFVLTQVPRSTIVPQTTAFGAHPQHRSPRSAAPLRAEIQVWLL